MVKLLDKIYALPQSRRWWAAVLALLSVTFQDGLGLSPEQAQWIVVALSAWIVGDSINKTV